MGDQEQINAGVGDALIKLLLRANVVAEADVLAIAEEYDLLATRAHAEHETEINEGVAHSLRCALLDVDPLPIIDPTREHQAQLQRQQIRARTKMIERDPSAG